jgi:hypothetical protein
MVPAARSVRFSLAGSLGGFLAPPEKSMSGRMSGGTFVPFRRPIRLSP